MLERRKLWRKIWDVLLLEEPVPNSVRLAYIVSLLLAVDMVILLDAVVWRDPKSAAILQLMMMTEFMLVFMLGLSELSAGPRSEGLGLPFAWTGSPSQIKPRRREACGSETFKTFYLSGVPP